MAQLPRRHQIQNNGTINANGNSGVLPNLGAGEDMLMELVLDITGAPTGTNPTLTFNVYEVHPGSGNLIPIDTFGPYTAALTNPVRHTITNLLGGSVQVNWTIGGTSSPTFTGVYLDLLFPSPNA